MDAYLVARFANGLATNFAGPASARSLAGDGRPMTIAGPGLVKPRFEAVPAGCENVVAGLAAAKLCAVTACGLTINFAAGIADLLAGWPIRVAGAGALKPRFDAVPLGTANSIDRRMSIRVSCVITLPLHDDRPLDLLEM